MKSKRYLLSLNKYLALNFWIISISPAFLNNKVEKYQTKTIFIYILHSKNINFSRSEFWSENQKSCEFFPYVSPKRSDMAIFMINSYKRVVRDMWSFRGIEWQCNIFRHARTTAYSLKIGLSSWTILPSGCGYLWTILGLFVAEWRHFRWGFLLARVAGWFEFWKLDTHKQVICKSSRARSKKNARVSSKY